MQNTPYSMIFVSDFNAKCTNWHKHDERNFEVIVIKKISLQSGLCQAINKPTHILKNSLCCIGLMWYLSTQAYYFAKCTFIVTIVITK